MADKRSNVPASSEARSGEGGRGGGPLMSLQREIDRLFDDFTRGFSLFPFGRGGAEWEPLMRLGSGGGALSPYVDVVEKDNAFEITAELPGLKEEDVDISLADGVLTMKGEKKEETEQREKGYYLSERRYGSFQRAFRLPDSIDEDKVEARFDNGVLRVTLPKRPEAVKQAKKISIQTGA